MAIIGNPQDILSTPYGLAGQMSPETAVAVQALNRRRLLANMLTQQGMQKPQGRMAGRFYVNPNPMEHVANLASTVAGAFGSRMIDKSQDELMQKDRESLESDKKKALALLMGEQQQQAQPPQPPPQSPYTGEQGAQPAPDVPVQSSAPAIPAQRPPSIAGQENMAGLDMANVTPADMSQFAGTGNQDPVAAPSAPVPPQAPGAQAQPAPPGQPSGMPDRSKMMEFLSQTMTNQHPLIRQWGAAVAQQMQREKEQEAARAYQTSERQAGQEFTAGQNADRNALTARGQDIGAEQNTLLRQMQQAQNDRTYDVQVKQLEQQQQNLQAQLENGRLSREQANEIRNQNFQLDLKRLQLDEAKANEAVRHNKVLESKPSEKQLAQEESVAKSKQDASETIAQLRDSYGQLKAGGGITSTANGALDNMKAAASASSIGQTVGGMLGTKNQSQRNTIAQMRPLLMTQVMRAMGITAKQLDSNAELKLWLSAATDPTMDHETNMRALDNLENLIGGGSKKQPTAGGVPTPSQSRTVTRTGMHNGKKVFQYSDGSIEYAP